MRGISAAGVIDMLSRKKEGEFLKFCLVLSTFTFPNPKLLSPPRFRTTTITRATRRALAITHGQIL